MKIIPYYKPDANDSYRTIQFVEIEKIYNGRDIVNGKVLKEIGLSEEKSTVQFIREETAKFDKPFHHFQGFELEYHELYEGMERTLVWLINNGKDVVGLLDYDDIFRITCFPKKEYEYNVFCGNELAFTTKDEGEAREKLLHSIKKEKIRTLI